MNDGAGVKVIYRSGHLLHNVLQAIDIGGFPGMTSWFGCWWLDVGS